MDKSRKKLIITYITCLLLFIMATILSVIDGKKPPLIISLLIIVPGTISFVRLVKNKAK
jgi:hypothetical protein